MATTIRQLTMGELEAGLEEILQSPADDGLLEMIVRRPAIGTRETVQRGELDPAVGLVGDTWSERSSRRSRDGLPHPDMQLNIMNARVVALVAQHASRWPLAGDQLFVDMDLSAASSIWLRGWWATAGTGAAAAGASMAARIPTCS